MKKIFFILVVLAIASMAYGRLVKPDIVKARLDTVTFKRITEPNKPDRIKVYLYGRYIDENGSLVANADPNRDLWFSDLPQEWQDSLLPILKTMSKQFNNEFAQEDTETF